VNGKLNNKKRGGKEKTLKKFYRWVSRKSARSATSIKCCCKKQDEKEI
jgi:hypothetical protein